MGSTLSCGRIMYMDVILLLRIIQGCREFWAADQQNNCCMSKNWKGGLDCKLHWNYPQIAIPTSAVKTNIIPAVITTAAMIMITKAAIIIIIINILLLPGGEDTLYLHSVYINHTLRG